MKQTLKLTGKALLASLLLTGGMAMAETGLDETYKNLTLEERLYLYDGYGAKWGVDAGSDGLWFVADRPVPDTYSAAFKIRNGAAANTLVIGNNDDTNTTNGYVGIGTDTPTVKLDVQWSDSDTANIHNLLAVSVNNAGAGASDVGFSLENKETDFKWTFRTYEPSVGFAASKIGTGGTEFEVGNIGTTTATTVVKMGGVTVFESGHLVTASSRSLKDEIEPLDTEAAMEALDALQPVSYVYKAHKGEKVVGFIAEDVPELVAMPSRKSLDSTEIVAVLTSVVKEQKRYLDETRAEMEAMKAKTESMEAKTEAMEAEIAELRGMK